MPHTLMRITRYGDKRWTGYAVLPNGKRLGVGTYDTEDRALTIATAEEKYRRNPDAEGYPPSFKATCTLGEYIPIFLGLHDVQPNTLDMYRSLLTKHVAPALGHLRVAEVDGSVIRRFLADLKTSGVGDNTRKHIRAALMALFAMAHGDKFRDDNPMGTIPPIKVTQQKIRVWTMPQIKQFLPHVRNAAARVLFDLIAQTGMRLGEATALTVDDILPGPQIYVGKSVAETSKTHSTTGQRFVVRDHTKNRTDRAVAIAKSTLAMLEEHIERYNLQPGDLLFPAKIIAPRTQTYRVRERISDEEMAAAQKTSFLAPNGKVYFHGTITGRIAGKCDCRYCKQARSDYDYARRQKLIAEGKITPGKPREIWDTSKHVGRSTLRTLWLEALDKAEMDATIPLKNLRHCHANALLARGWDGDRIADRLGNTSKVLAQHYLVLGDLTAELLDDLEDLAA